MNDAIRALRRYFKSEEWRAACLDPQQPVVSDQGLVCNADRSVCLNTKINLALEFEGQFNEMAARYMRYRKEQGLAIND